MKQILSDLSESIGQHDIALRIDTQTLETAYVSVEDDAVMVHDRGETFFYIRSAEEPGGDNTYTSWSRDAAQGVLNRLTVDLAGYDNEDEAYFRLQIRLAPSDDVGAAIERLAAATEEVFEVHTREDLRRTWE